MQLRAAKVAEIRSGCRHVGMLYYLHIEMERECEKTAGKKRFQEGRGNIMWRG